MTYPSDMDLFTQPTIEEARKMRDEALARASAEFVRKAKDFVIKFLQNGPASGEDITDACKAAGIRPRNDKAFGAVYMSLSRSGTIVKAGHAQRRKGHASDGGNIWKLSTPQQPCQ